MKIGLRVKCCSSLNGKIIAIFSDASRQHPNEIGLRVGCCSYLNGKIIAVFVDASR